MAVQAQESEILVMCSEFFQESLAFNLTLYGIAKWAFIAALVLILIHAAVAIWKTLKAPPPSADPEVRVNSVGAEAATGLVKALPALIDSLAKAPGAIVLIILGLLLVWVPTVDAPAICEEPLSQTVGDDPPTGDDAANDTAEEAAEAPSAE